MSLLLISSLLMQAAALWLTMRAVGKKLLAFNGALLVVTLCLYHGLTEIIQMLLPGRNIYRAFVSQENVDRWALVAGTAILLFAVAYVVTLGEGTKRFRCSVWAGPLAVPLTPLLMLAIPAFVVALQGRGRPTNGSWMAAISGELFLIAIVMCTVGLVFQCPRKWAFSLLVCQAILLSLTGSRLTVLAGFVMTAGATARFGRALRVREIGAAILVLGAIAVSVSATRQYFGREAYSGSISELVQSIGSAGQMALTHGNQGLADDLAYRLDGNSFGAMVYAGFRQGYTGAGFRSIWNNIWLYIPSVFYATKLDSAVEDRNEEAYTISHFSLTSSLDLTPTLLVFLYSYYGVPTLICGAGILGFAFAHFDRWVNKGRSMWSYLVGIGLAYCCIFTEQGTSVYFGIFRGILAMLFLMRFGSFLRTKGSLPRDGRRHRRLVMRYLRSIGQISKPGGLDRPYASLLENRT